MKSSTISAPQFFSILYLSSLASIFMYISSPQTIIASADSVLRPLFFAVANLVVAIPMFRALKKYGFFKGSKQAESKTLHKIVAVLYGGVYLTGALMTVARFDLFASSELFPGTEMTVFIIGLIAVCVYLSFLGIGSLGKASSLFTVVVVSATVFAGVTLSKQVDFLNFTPALENGVSEFLYDSLLFCVQASEIGTILVFASQISGNVRKNYIVWSVLSAISFAFIIFFVAGTLGLFADTKLFPTYSAVSLAEFGLFERLDALETAIWVLCVVTKLSFYIITAEKCFSYAFSGLSIKAAGIGVGLIIALVTIYISADVKKFEFLSLRPLVVAVYIVPVIILPCILLLKRRKSVGEKA